MKNTLTIFWVLIAGLAHGQKITTTTIGGQTVTRYSNQNSTYNVPSYGYVQRSYDHENGIWRYYVNGAQLDYNYFGSLKTLSNSATFDLGKVGQFGRLETNQKFGLIWKAFREMYALNSEGKYILTNNAKTPATKLTLNEFAHFAAEARPVIQINSIEKCPRCDGKRTRPGIIATGAIGELPCENCNAYGSIANQENFSLIFSGVLPERPKLADFIKEGSITEHVAKTGAAPAPMPAPPPPGLPMQAQAPPASSEPAKAPLTPEEQFSVDKSKAEAGDAQAQYELGLHYAQIHFRVVALDYFEAFTWMKKAALKNHRMAQYQLGRFYEQGKGTEKNLGEAIKWYRSSALLGCKQSQRWMGQIYYMTFLDITTYEDFIKKDISNLIEAYAWFMLAAEPTVIVRKQYNIVADDEKPLGHILNSRDYSPELSTQGSCKAERDNIARKPEFTKTISDSAKSRFLVLKTESEEHRKENKPK